MPNSVSEIISAAMPTVKSRAPMTSIELRRTAGASRRKNQKPAAASRPIGMLIQKIQAHDSFCTMSAPSIGPSTADTAHTLAR